jgi:hypothetical protein
MKMSDYAIRTHTSKKQSRGRWEAGCDVPLRLTIIVTSGKAYVKWAVPYKVDVVKMATTKSSYAEFHGGHAEFRREKQRKSVFALIRVYRN